MRIPTEDESVALGYLRQDPTNGEWTCWKNGCDRINSRSGTSTPFSTPVLALAHVFRHFELPVPPEYQTYWCCFCEASGGPQQIERHYPAWHAVNGNGKYKCNYCHVARWKRLGPLHDDNYCPVQYLSKLNRSWNRDHVGYCWYGNLTLKVLLCIEPEAEIAAGINQARELELYRRRLRTDIDVLNRQLPDAQIDGTAPSLRRRIEALNLELNPEVTTSGSSSTSLSKSSRLSQRQHQYYFSARDPAGSP